jgi:hypothetical protein
MDDETIKPAAEPAKRLCSEIQLFDLCELESCKHKEGRFCTNQELLERFENINEVDVRSSDRFQGNEDNESEGEDDLGYDDALDADGYGDDEGGWEDE